MQEALPNVVGILVILTYAVTLVAIIWGFYLAYLATRALQIYLRS